MPSEAQKLICESAGINEDEYHRRIEMYKESSKKDERNRIWLSENLLTLARDYRGKTIAINYEKGVVAANQNGLKLVGSIDEPTRNECTLVSILDDGTIFP